jgi:hypothetical protein
VTIGRAQELSVPRGSCRDMSNQEPSVWAVASYLVWKHGDAAAAVAQREATRLSQDHERESHVWSAVARATAELLRVKRRTGERMH